MSLVRPQECRYGHHMGYHSHCRGRLHLILQQIDQLKQKIYEMEGKNKVISRRFNEYSCVEYIFNRVLKKEEVLNSVVFF